jgi:hypothetical protein
MTDERNDGAGEPTKIFSNMTAWLGGITGLVVAITGLIAVWPRAKEAEPVELAAVPAEDSAADDAASEDSTAEEPVQETASALPLNYKAVGATFEKIDGEWVYTSETEETHYKEVSRRDGSTVVFDPAREVYARWPNQGGRVEEKGADDEANWEFSFDIWVSKAVASADQ